MTTWGDVQRGDAVKLGERVLVVKKAKRDGKRVRVVIKDHLGTFERDVKAKDKVKIVQESVLKIGGGIDFDKLGKQMGLHDDTGGQQRWAKPVESPEHGPATGSPWTTQADRAEEALATIGARLVEESVDGRKSWYVPPVDATTVASHLYVMHQTDPSQFDTERAMIDHHTDLHNGGMDYTVPHTHQETRP